MVNVGLNEVSSSTETPPVHTVARSIYKAYSLAVPVTVPASASKLPVLFHPSIVANSTPFCANVISNSPLFVTVMVYFTPPPLLTVTALLLALSR